MCVLKGFPFSSHGLKYLMFQQLGRANVTCCKRARLGSILKASFLRKELFLMTLDLFLYIRVPETKLSFSKALLNK